MADSDRLYVETAETCTVQPSGQKNSLYPVTSRSCNRQQGVHCHYWRISQSVMDRDHKSQTERFTPSRPISLRSIVILSSHLHLIHLSFRFLQLSVTKLCRHVSIFSCVLGRGHSKETDNSNATALSENCYQPELNTEWRSVNWGNGNTTRGKTEKLNFQAKKHASILIIALPRGFLVSAVVHV
jgi:hypothetical protein